MSTPSVLPSLEGVGGKIGRANDHLEHLKRVLRERANTTALSTVRTDDETKQRVIETTLQEPPEVPLLAKLLIGDVVHSLAASLDHLVYQLSLSHQLQLGTIDPVAVCDNGGTGFPIFLPPKDDKEKRETERRINKRLALMAQEPADIIRAMQPYKRAEVDPTLNPIQDPLWILYQLDVIDKHRVVLATSEDVRMDRLTISGPEQPSEVIEFPQAEWQPFKHGTKLFDVALDPGHALKPDVKFHAHVSAQVKFTETGLWCDGKPTVALLAKLIDFVERVVVKRLAPYVV